MIIGIFNSFIRLDVLDIFLFGIKELLFGICGNSFGVKEKQQGSEGIKELSYKHIVDILNNLG